VSKAGLLHAIFSRLEAEAWAALVEDVKTVDPPEACLHAWIRGLGALSENPSSAAGLTEVLAHGLRDPVVRGRIVSDYDLTATAPWSWASWMPARMRSWRAATAPSPASSWPPGAAPAARRSWRLSRARRFRARRRPDAAPRAGCPRAPARGARLP